MLLLLSPLILKAGQTEFLAPAGNRVAQVIPGGETVLPSGRLVTPIGQRHYTGETLWKVLWDPQSDRFVGFREGGLDVYTLTGETWTRKPIEIKESTPAGAFLPGGKVWMSQGDAGNIILVDLNEGKVVETIALGKGAFAVDLTLSSDGRWAYVLDLAHQQLLVVDLTAKKVVNRVRGGRQPYALVRSDDGRRLYVANIGLFDYRKIAAPRPGEGSPKGISRPAFGFPSKDAEDGVEFEGRKVEGLGKAGITDAQSIWSYDLSDPTTPVKRHSVTAGLLIHAPIEGSKAVGGSAPCALALHGGKIFVANSNNDTVQEFDDKSLQLKRTIRLAPQPLLRRYRGVIPSSLAIDPSAGRLYVTESGVNAVASIDLSTGNVIGEVPTGWFPVSIALKGQSWIVGTMKGLGRGPRGEKTPRLATDERYGFPDMPGMIQRGTIPADSDFQKGHEVVLRNNGLVPVAAQPKPKAFPGVAGKASPTIKHVVFITKENHTFDGIFGALPGANGEPAYAEFGDPGWISEKGRSARASIMPNHLKLAREFAISDNFYMEPQASGDGHRWLVGVYPSLWTTRVFYSGWNFNADNDQPGRFVSFGSNGSQIPEDYLENGSLWEHLDRGKVSFRNYGEGFEFPGVDEADDTEKSGAWEIANFPMPLVLFKNTCFEFPIFNMNIPDVARVQWFIDDIEKNYRKKKKPLPRFINIALCNDHGTRPNPKAGYPYVCSWMADNDLALGRLVEYLSSQPEWKEMAIFVTQDDSGGDADHVDRHRSFVLGIGPWMKRGHVSKAHTSIISILRTIYGLFGLGPNNLFDATATPLDDFFTDRPDFTPYRAVAPSLEVFDPKKTVDPSDPKFIKRKKMRGEPMDSREFLDWLYERGKRVRLTGKS